MSPRVVAVTVAHGRRQHLARLQRSLSAGRPAPYAWVLVSMSDPALDAWRTVYGLQPCTVPMAVDPTALPLAAARNHGAATALDLGAEVLVFLDADCLVDPELVGAYAEVATAHEDVVWSGPVTYLPPGLDEEQQVRPWQLDDPHPARPAPPRGAVWEDAEPELFWSLSFAMTASAWRRSGGFHEEYAGYGGEDTDFALQAAGRGLGFGWVGAARAYHQHHEVSSPPVQHLEDILTNGRLFHRRWGRWPMQGWFDDFERLGLVRRTAQGWERAER